MARRNHRNAKNSNKNMSNTNKEEMKKNQTTAQNSEEQKTPTVVEETPAKKKAYDLPAEWKISVIAKKKFNNLPTILQNGAGKEACIKQALSDHKDLIPDPMRYWIWLIDETEKLCRVWDFAEICDKYGRDPLTVAQHLILEGKMVCNGIRMDGLESYGSNITMFNEPLFKDEFRLFADMKKNKAVETYE